MQERCESQKGLIVYCWKKRLSKIKFVDILLGVVS